jgi:hypothetical protein
MLPCCAIAAFVIATVFGWASAARRGLRRLATAALAIELGLVLGLGGGVALAAYFTPASVSGVFCFAQSPSTDNPGWSSGRRPEGQR